MTDSTENLSNTEQTENVELGANALSAAVSKALGAASPAAVLAGKRAFEIMVNVAKSANDAWGQLRELFEPLSIDEAKFAAADARSSFSEWGKSAGISDKAASVYLSEFIRCKFNGLSIPESRKDYKALCKKDDFATATKAGARPKGTKPSDNAPQVEAPKAEGEQAQTQTQPANVIDLPPAATVDEAQAYSDIRGNINAAVLAGLRIEAISVRIAELLDSMVTDALELAELQRLEDEDNARADEANADAELVREMANAA